MSEARPGGGAPLGEAAQRAAEQSGVLWDELRAAAAEGREERLLALVDEAGDVDARNSFQQTPLHWAAWSGRAGVVARLLGRGADARASDRCGWTALHFAAAYDASGRCAALLLGAGADVHCSTHDGCTPLHVAAFESKEAAVRLLLAAGADRAARDLGGQTPLHFARTDAVRRLLRGGVPSAQPALH